MPPFAVTAGICERPGTNECTRESRAECRMRKAECGRQNVICEFKTRVRDETPDSPSHWLPTPASTSSPVKKQGRRVLSSRPQAACWLRL